MTFISAQLPTNAVRMLRKVWVLILRLEAIYMCRALAHLVVGDPVKDGVDLGWRLDVGRHGMGRGQRVRAQNAVHSARHPLVQLSDRAVIQQSGI